MASVQRKALIDSVALTASVDGDRLSVENFFSEPIAYIKATDVHAATTVDAEIQHSPDGVDWFTFQAFTNIVGAAGSEELSVTKFMFPHMRAKVVLSGATQEATVTVALFVHNRK